MEIILRLYLLPYNELYPVISFDERPCFLIGDRIEPKPMKSGSVAKENYSYTKHGSCCVLAAIEPLTGRRIVHIKEQRRKIEFAEIMKEIVENYPKAQKIKIILDNLNTHNTSSFYERYDAEIAAELSDKIEFIYTPKNASWLNMIEIEFSALSRLALNKRISTFKGLSKQVQAFFKDRDLKQIKFEWLFDRTKARKVMNRHYVKVNKENAKYLKT